MVYATDRLGIVTAIDALLDIVDTVPDVSPHESSDHDEHKWNRQLPESEIKPVSWATDMVFAGDTYSTSDAYPSTRCTDHMWSKFIP